ncbi:hypothetical protein BJ166DRAFT_491889 [Pestalotiopsis sp. NC0098]|nr:hypothetical protein BJ166DRAFT_491889 [Pestalotiopsis sp. NC0098]
MENQNSKRQRDKDKANDLDHDGLNTNPIIKKQRPSVTTANNAAAAAPIEIPDPSEVEFVNPYDPIQQLKREGNGAMDLAAVPLRGAVPAQMNAAGEVMGARDPQVQEVRHILDSHHEQFSSLSQLIEEWKEKSAAEARAIKEAHARDRAIANQQIADLSYRVKHDIAGMKDFFENNMRSDRGDRTRGSVQQMITPSDRSNIQQPSVQARGPIMPPTLPFPRPENERRRYPEFDSLETAYHAPPNLAYNRDPATPSRPRRESTPLRPRQPSMIPEFQGNFGAAFQVQPAPNIANGDRQSVPFPPTPDHNAERRRLHSIMNVSSHFPSSANAITGRRGPAQSLLPDLSRPVNDRHRAASIASTSYPAASSDLRSIASHVTPQRAVQGLNNMNRASRVTGGVIGADRARNAIQELGLQPEEFTQVPKLSKAGFEQILKTFDFADLERLESLAMVDGIGQSRHNVMFCDISHPAMHNDYVVQAGEAAYSIMEDAPGVKWKHIPSIKHHDLSRLRIFQLHYDTEALTEKQIASWKEWRNEQQPPEYVYEIGALSLRSKYHKKMKDKVYDTDFSIVMDVVRPSRPVWMILRPGWKQMCRKTAKYVRDASLPFDGSDEVKIGCVCKDIRSLELTWGQASGDSSHYYLSAQATMLETRIKAPIKLVARSADLAKMQQAIQAARGEPILIPEDL